MKKRTTIKVHLKQEDKKNVRGITGILDLPEEDGWEELFFIQEQLNDDEKKFFEFTLQEEVETTAREIRHCIAKSEIVSVEFRTFACEN